jgi:uncharacterized coiled-coil protein SlyX
MTDLDGALNSGDLGWSCAIHERIKLLRGHHYRVELRLERIEQWLSDLDVRLANVRDDLEQQQLNLLHLIERIESIKQSDSWKRSGGVN